MSNKNVLQNLMQYVFDKDAVKVREALHESLIEMILTVQDRAMTINTIIHEIERDMGITLDSPLVSEIVNQLIQKGSIKKDKRTDKYFLVSLRKKELVNKIKGREAEFKSLEKKFLSIFRKMVGKVETKTEEIALEYFYYFCTKLFSSSSDLLLGFLLCNTKGIERINNYEPPSQLLGEILAVIPDTTLKEGLEKTFKQIFRDEKSAKILEVIARNYLYFQILNIDPECKSLQRELFSQKIVFLDTNFIMSLILTSRLNHRAAIKCVNLSQKLGVQFRYTKRTQQEFLSQLQQSQERFSKLTIKNLEIMSTLDDDFIADYAMELQKGKGKNWSSYCSKLRILKKILLGLKIEEYSDIETDLSIATSESFSSIRDIVIRCGLRWTNIKNDEVAEHDAHHLLLVRKLRDKNGAEPLLGPKYWFLTFDQSLLCADKEINGLLGTKMDLPSSIECWAWFELISPFVGGSVSKESAHEAFAFLMKTNFRALPPRTKTKKLIAIAAKVDLSEFSAAQAVAVTNDEFVNQYLGELTKAKWTKSKEDKKQAKKKLEDRVEEVALSVKEEPPSEKSSSNIEYVARIASLIFACIMVFVGIYSFSNSRTVDGIICLLFAVAFTAMSIGYKKIELWGKELKLRLQN